MFKFLQCRVIALCLSTFLLMLPFKGFAQTQKDIVLSTMETELNRSFKVLKSVNKPAIYFLQYTITDLNTIRITASYGAIEDDSKNNNRYLTVDTRVGSSKLDNTHELRGDNMFSFASLMPSEKSVTIEDDPTSLRASLWTETDKNFKKAQEQFIKVTSEKTVKVTETDTSPDFSSAKPYAFTGQTAKLDSVPASSYELLRKTSSYVKKYPWIYYSSISLNATATNKYLVNSEGTKIKNGNVSYLLGVYVGTTANDGMKLYLYKPFYSKKIEDLPDENKIIQTIDSLIQNLKALRDAPIVEPYTGPAILKNYASAVFFHEIFGHRIEGHRQKSEKEGQTFTKKVGEKILPDFISVYDNPTQKKFGNEELNGYYLYDDEGILAEKVPVVENGILKNFLMSRSPVENFSRSNGHGRREHGYKVVARQGNLMVESKNTVPFAKLREMLIQECKKQNKPYGLVFEDISGGFTITQRSFVQAFKVIPLLVWRVYADGKPDEIVRGVDIVGTPLASFSNILATADDYAVFNGYCGAESGSVPVSCVSPSILVSEIEVEKKEKGQEKPPILPAPLEKK
ncbi:MAG: metallopeptidase TldD-related protein [bacterium]|nr:metallopeptidase TldD-related protein [bacterium]